MTTEHEETEKLRACPFCGALLSKNSENDSASFCGNVNCPFSGIEAFDSWWNSSYCWKLLDEKEEELGAQDAEIIVLRGQKAELEKELTLSRSAVRRLREALESIPHDVDICGPKKCSPSCSACRIDSVLQETALFEAESTKTENLCEHGLKKTDHGYTCETGRPAKDSGKEVG